MALKRSSVRFRLAPPIFACKATTAPRSFRITLPPAVAVSTREAIDDRQWPENDSSLNGDVSIGDNVGSLILIKAKPVAS
jgi:hypothetical protein